MLVQNWLQTLRVQWQNNSVKLGRGGQATIADFLKDPIGNSSKEWLAKATADNPTSGELLRRAMGRVGALKTQLRGQAVRLQQIMEALSNLGK